MTPYKSDLLDADAEKLHSLLGRRPDWNFPRPSEQLPETTFQRILRERLARDSENIFQKRPQSAGEFLSKLLAPPLNHRLRRVSTDFGDLVYYDRDSWFSDKRDAPSETNQDSSQTSDLQSSPVEDTTKQTPRTRDLRVIALHCEDILQLADHHYFRSPPELQLRVQKLERVALEFVLWLERHLEAYSEHPAEKDKKTARK